jgi:hypothetical protein
MAKVSARDWVYLAVSMAASYYLILAQRGDDADWELRLLHSCVNACRWVRQRAGKAEVYFMDARDEALERYQC